MILTLFDFGVPLVNMAILLSLVFLSRRWTGPSQAVRMEAIEDEQHVLRGNLRRVDRDVTEWRREATEMQERILRELAAIRQNGAKEDPLEDAVRQVRDRVEDLEQAIHGLACGQQACPSPSKE